jgi:hypothetical protein
MKELASLMNDIDERLQPAKDPFQVGTMKNGTKRTDQAQIALAIRLNEVRTTARTARGRSPAASSRQQVGEDRPHQVG